MRQPRLSAFQCALLAPGAILLAVLLGAPIALMAGLMIPQMVAGILAGRDRTIEDEC